MLKRIIFYLSKLSRIDFFRKLLLFLIKAFSPYTLALKIKAILYFKSKHVKIGKNVSINGLLVSSKIGNNLIIFNNCNFEFNPKCTLEIGSNVIFSYGVTFVCNTEIKIGNDVQIGEYTSLRDTTHNYENKTVPIKYQKDISEPIKIEDNVWVGRGCIILPGASLESGVIVAANSVVKGKLLKNGIYGGNPAKLIKYRH